MLQFQSVKDILFSTKNTLNIKGKIVDLSTPKVMGIINATPDSFYAGSRSMDENAILGKAENMLETGATFLDIGGYSSRPGSEDIPVEEETRRVTRAIRAIMKHFPDTLISIDSFRTPVVKSAFDEGAVMINDISGGQLDTEMFQTAAEFRAPYILMHMKGTPQTMQQLVDYEDVVLEVMDYFQKRVVELQNSGVSDILIDPGFGFSKTVDQNYVLLKNLGYFKALELPLLVGLSRKSMIFKTLGGRTEDTLNGTTVLNTIALMQGVKILRVHDVKEAVEAITLVEACNL